MDTNSIAKQPVFFEKNRVFRVYLGGKLFSDFFGDNSEDSFYPEEWICSSTKALNAGSTDEFEGLSAVKGTNIHFNELIENEKEFYNQIETTCNNLNCSKQSYIKTAIREKLERDGL